MDLAPPKDLSHYYSRVLQRTLPSQFKQFYPYFTLPGVGNLAGGLPDPTYFPFDTLEAQIAVPNRFAPTPNATGNESSKTTPESAATDHSRILVPHDSSEGDVSRKIDVASGLQYGNSMGYPPLHQWIKEFTTTKLVPHVPYQGGPDIIPTLGNTDGFSKVMHAFTDIWDDRKDWIRDRQGILCEEFVYTTPLEYAITRGLNIVPVAVDAQGMLVDGPGGLKDVLENWDRTKGKLPHMMYTVPTGQNPTGGIPTMERKQMIYSLCSQYDIILVEDEPYWFLQYPSARELTAKHRVGATSTQEATVVTSGKAKTSGSAFLDSLVPSYLSIDVDGRVIRLDTFSKTIAPGCRLGWITAQPTVTARIFSFADLMTQQPSGFVQSMVSSVLLGQRSPIHQNSRSGNAKKGEPVGSWQMDGWIRWLEGLRGNYERRMQLTSQILEEGKYKFTGLRERDLKYKSSMDDEEFEIISKVQMLDFAFPMGGMFLWLRVLFENHPLFGHPDISNADLSKAFWLLLITPKYKVLIGPGSLFAATPQIRTEKAWPYFRICYAAVSEELLRTNSHNIVQAANEFFDMTNPSQIQQLLDDDPIKHASAIALLQAEMYGGPSIPINVY